MLLTPGPTAVPEFVRTAMSSETLHHRTPEFENIFKETRELLLELFDMPEAVMLGIKWNWSYGSLCDKLNT